MGSIKTAIGVNKWFNGFTYEIDALQIYLKWVRVGWHRGKSMPQIPFCDVICDSEVKVQVAFPPPFLDYIICDQDV